MSEDLLVYIYTRGVQKVLQIDFQKIHKALEFDFINPSKYSPLAAMHFRNRSTQL